MNIHDLKQKYQRCRAYTESLCADLKTEDVNAQPVDFVSPPKWHLAHTSWFFEQFILLKKIPDYQVFDPRFSFLFNSYYHHEGERALRAKRGANTRPSWQEVLEYRQYVDKHLLLALEQHKDLIDLEVLRLGLAHEEQHQELLYYDIKYILGNQYFPPKVNLALSPKQKDLEKENFIEVPGGNYLVGTDDSNFSFDHERPQHKVYLAPFSIAQEPVTNGEYLAFINDQGYQNFNYWHDDGWTFIQNEKIQAPLYWRYHKNEWWEYGPKGMQLLDLSQYVCHVSYYEAHAFAQWRKMRLATEQEWEVASEFINWGQVWEWTNSAYLAYPGYRQASGALGEYNGKFMVNQMVLRGASFATPKGHSRKSYRNFFYPSMRWMTSGIRLSKDL